MFGIATTSGRFERRTARRLSTWSRDYLRGVALADLGCAAVGVFIAAQLRFGMQIGNPPLADVVHDMTDGDADVPMAMLDQFGAESDHSPVLLAAVAVRNNNRGSKSTVCRGARYALAVVAGRGGDHSRASLLRVKPHHLRERSTDFESTNRLDRLHLDVDVAARLIGEGS